MKIVTAEQIRQIDEECGKIGLPTHFLMENAGRGVAEEVSRILDDIGQQRVLLLIGPGNNGGDGLVAARYLHDWGANVAIYLLGQRPADDPNLELVRQRDIKCIDATGDDNLRALSECLSSATAVIDALFGTGKSRPLGDNVIQVLNEVSRAKEGRPEIRIIALDLPSGLDADTGAAEPACLYADNTVTLGFPKIGLFNSSAIERAGKLTVVDIGIPPELAEKIPDDMITARWVRSVLPERPLWANKGSFGKVLVVAGSINYIGAAYLACSGAVRVGAGLVTLATAASLQPVLAAKLNEVTYLPLPESPAGIISPKATRHISREIVNYDVLLMGCGLGQHQSTVRFVRSVLFRLKPALPMVLDADVLNTLAGTTHWWQQLPGDAILTPHPGEMARLAGVTVDEVQSDRLGIAKRIALVWNKTVVLKGAYTVVVSPDGRSRISPVANSGLASAGTGDVLAGVIAGLVAQGLSLSGAAACGVYLHGRAGDMVRDNIGDAGMTATDLLPVLPQVIRQIKEKV